MVTPADVELQNVTNVFIDVFYHEKELVDVHSSGRVWSGEDFTDSLLMPITLDDMVAGESVAMQLDVMGRSSSVFKVDAYDRNDTLFKDATISAYSSTIYGRELQKKVSWTPISPDLRLNIKINATSSATVFLDKILINYPRLLRYHGIQLPFTMAGDGLSSQTLRLDNVNDDLMLWDVTSPLEPVNVNYYKQDGSAFFETGEGNLNSFVAFEVSNAKKPITIRHIENQNLHSVAYADMIVLVPSRY